MEARMAEFSEKHQGTVMDRMAPVYFPVPVQHTVLRFDGGPADLFPRNRGPEGRNLTLKGKDDPREHTRVCCLRLASLSRQAMTGPWELQRCSGEGTYPSHQHGSKGHF